LNDELRVLCGQPGKYYYEAVVTDEGLCRVGWSTLKATLDLGTDKEGFGFGGTGKKSFGRQFDSYGEVSLISTIGFYVFLVINHMPHASPWMKFPMIVDFYCSFLVVFCCCSMFWSRLRKKTDQMNRVHLVNDH